MRLNSLAGPPDRRSIAVERRRAPRCRPHPHLALSPDRSSVPSTSASRVYLQTLVGMLAAQTPADLSDPGNLGEQRFELPYSGWYWQVRRGRTGRSCSPRNRSSTTSLDFAKATDQHDVDGRHRRRAARSGRPVAPRASTARIDFGPGNSYESSSPAMPARWPDEIAAFRRNVLLTLAVFGIGLVIAITAQIRWGLRPLDRVRREPGAICGAARKPVSTGPFPAEIEPLAKELNALLESNQQIIERARTQVGNLAHALKTPLSVITNEARAARGPLAEKVDRAGRDHAARRSAHYLDRARIAARSKVIGAVTEVEPVVGRLVRAMNRIHEDRGLALTADVRRRALFRGEQQDLEEIIGNLVDNACKWAKSEVTDRRRLSEAAERRFAGPADRQYRR